MSDMYGDPRHDMAAVNLAEDCGPVDPASVGPFRASYGLHLRHHMELLGVIRSFLAESRLPTTFEFGDLMNFAEAATHNPAFRQEGTTSANGGLWLFAIARALVPGGIVNSGTWYGSSLYTLRSAVPNAKLYAFDLDYSRLLFKSDTVEYRTHDFGTAPLRAETPTDLCYFNDHINNCLRIRQCHERGFKHLVLDDSPDLGELQYFRYPALPTVAMITQEKWNDGDVIEWVWDNKYLRRYTFRTADTFGARDLIDHCHRLPALRRWTGMGDSFMYYVKLK